MWRLLKLVAGGGMLVLLSAGALMVWPLLWPSDPDASVRLVNGRLLGEATGYVGHIDRDARTVDVSASLLGWRPVVLVVNESTAILVHNRLGGFGDLWKDMPVRVAYEVLGNRRLARSIEVVAGDDRQSSGVVNGAAPGMTVAPPFVAPPAAVSPPAVGLPAPAGAADPGPIPLAPETPPASAVASSPPAPVPEPSRHEEVPPAKPTPVPEPPRRAEAPPAKPIPVPEPPRRAEVPPAKPTPVPEPPRRAQGPPAKPAPTPDPPRSVEAPSAKPAPAATPRREAPPARPPRPEPAPASPGRSSSPAETDTGDGAAAVDWLLKGSRP